MIINTCQMKSIDLGGNNKKKVAWDLRKLITWLIDFYSMTTCLGLFYALRKCIYCTLIFGVDVSKQFFLAHGSTK